MFKQLFRTATLLLILAAAGCGSVPEVIVQAAKQSAKEEIEQKIDELLAELGDQLDLSMFFPADWNMNLDDESEPGRGPQR